MVVQTLTLKSAFADGRSTNGQGRAILDACKLSAGQWRCRDPLRASALNSRELKTVAQL